VSFTADELTRIDAARERLEELVPAARHDVTVAFGGTLASVRFSDFDAARFHRSRYRHMLATGEPELTAYAASRGDVTHFWVPGVASYRWDRHVLAPHEIAFLADAVATTHFFSSLPDTFVFHAGAVAGASAAAAIVGTTEAGKTTTALACTRRGMRLFSDEFCFVSPAGVVPYPRSLNLRAGGIELLAQSASSASPLDAWVRSHRGADRQDVGFDELFGGWEPAAPVPLRAVFIVTGRTASASACAVPAARMLPRVLPWTRMQPQGIEAARALLQVLQGVECYELQLGSPDDTAALIAETVAGAGPPARVS
jgi:hypothetical protein